MTQKQDKKPGGKRGADAGGSPKDGEAKIKDRQQAERDARERRARERRARAATGSDSHVQQNEAVMPLIPMEDFVAGDVATGHHIAFNIDDRPENGAVFELIPDNRLVLVNGTAPELLEYLKVGPTVFLAIQQIVNDSFNSPLSGLFADKQYAMWNHIRDALGDGGLDQLEDRLIAERSKGPKDKPIVMVGEDYGLWNSAHEDIGTAFEAMTDDKMAEVRVGKMPNQGVVLGFQFDGRKIDGMEVYVGHVGEAHPLSGQMVEGAFLWCGKGKLPDALPEAAVVANPLVASASKLLQYLMVLDRPTRDAIMHGMYHATKRIGTERAEAIRLANAKKVVPLTIVPSTPPPQAPAPEAAVAQPAASAPKSDADYARTLREAGFTASEVMAALEERAMGAAKHSA